MSSTPSLSRLDPKNSGTLAFHIFNSLCLFHHLHFLSVADAFVPSISLNFNGVNFIHTYTHTRRHTHTIKTSKPAVAHFPEGAISKIAIVSCPKCSHCPFVFVLKHVGIVMLFGTDSPRPYRRSVPNVMALRVD